MVYLAAVQARRVEGNERDVSRGKEEGNENGRRRVASVSARVSMPVLQVQPPRARPHRRYVVRRCTHTMSSWMCQFVHIWKTTLDGCNSTIRGPIDSNFFLNCSHEPPLQFKTFRNPTRHVCVTAEPLSRATSGAPRERCRVGQSHGLCRVSGSVRGTTRRGCIRAAQKCLVARETRKIRRDLVGQSHDIFTGWHQMSTNTRHRMVRC